MNDTLNLDVYLQRLGYSGDRAPTLATLAELQRRHVETFPFENLTSYLGGEVPLDTATLEAKLLHGGRGGYCFEHNRVFQLALRQLGFQVRGLAARVFWNQSEDAQPPTTHMLLHVLIDGVPWIADTGFGALTPTAPLRLDVDGEQATSHEPYRVRQSGADYRLEAKLGAQWRLLYRFPLHEVSPADYRLFNWYVSHHPESLFVAHLVSARVEAGCRHTLLDHRYTVRFPDGASESHELEDADRVLDLLERVFRVRVGDMRVRDQQALRQRLALETEDGVR
ncbi:MAG: arylamine N-acetyltransferase [Alcanivorax sp.]|jgi:N-hydroxyarylamine O-acetyltransferase|nr:arylamine N-acetyltransferase [Alcanivorax sp.]